MDAQDFEIPSPKRQRTESPEPATGTNPTSSNLQPLPSENGNLPNTTEMVAASNETADASVVPGVALPYEESQLNPTPAQTQIGAAPNTFLDALMLHVESISQGDRENLPDTSRRKDVNRAEINENVDQPPENTERGEQAQELAAQVQDTNRVPDPQEAHGLESEHVPSIDDPKFSSFQREDAGGVSLEQDQTMADMRRETDGIPTNTGNTGNDHDQVMQEAQPQAVTGATTAEGPEWEVDSSPYVSSDSDSSDTSSDDSDDDDDDGDGDYAMLDPEEQARILMAGDGGSDDEGDKKGKTEGGHLRTANEKVEEVIPKPDIVVTDEMEIEELGTVEGVVEKTVLIKAKISGEYQVLESNSVVCLADRSVVGVIAEPLGRVEQPMYTIRFTNDEAIKEAGLSEKGTRVFYVPKHSTFVFTQPLKAVKGSDASNFHDEEVGDDEMEFSDDEAEAEHKRQMKLKKQGRRDDGGGRGRGRGGRANYQRGGRQDFRHPNETSSMYGGAATEINYDDVPEGADEGYTPLARPANLSEMMAGIPREPTEDIQFSTGPSDRNRDSGMGRGRGRGRGRGERGYRGGRGSRGGGGGSQPSWTSHHGGSPTQSQQSPQSMLPPQFPYQQFQQPHQPHLSPQHQTFSPSPITPLRMNPFNFNFQQQQHAQQQWPGTQTFGHFPPQQSFQLPNQNQQQRPGQFDPNGWNASQAAAAQAQVAAHLEQLRRNEGQ